MNIETLLYPIHDRDLNENHSPISDLCRQEKKHLTVVVFSESAPIPLMTVGYPEAAEGWARNMALAEAELTASTGELEEKLNQQDLRVEVRGECSDGVMVDEIIAKHAGFSDLVLMKRRSGSVQTTFFKRLCHGALFQAGKPVLVFNSPPSDFNFKKILVAWDGNRAANRAITESLPMLKNAESVHVLSVDTDKTLPTRDEGPAWDVSTYLAQHQIPITLDIRESNQQSEPQMVSQIIRNRAKEIDADLIVTGAYGHSRLRERIFGGTTRELLELCDLPLMMVH